MPTALAPIFATLSRTATREQYEQILGAVNASPILTKDLELLVARKLLTAIEVPPGRNTASVYNAWANRSVIVLYADFLKALREAAPGDGLQPNNTAFCLAHLAHHLLADPAAPDGNSPADIRRRLDREAVAFIRGWNAVVDAAVQANGGTSLDPSQVKRLRATVRYRHALATVELLPSGAIETNPLTIGAIAAVLRDLPQSDLY